MRPDVPRRVDDAAADEAPAVARDALPGLQQLPPLLRAVLVAHAHDWHGAMHVRDERGQTLCELHAEAGWLIVGGTDAREAACAAVRQACANRAANVSLVADPRRPAQGSRGAYLIDPLVLTGEVVRAGLVDDAVSEALAAISGKSLILRAPSRARLERHGLTPEERQVVQQLAARPQTLDALRESSPVCASTLHRLLFLLWASESLAVRPLRRSEPREPRPGESFIRSSGEEEPTRVVRRDTQPDDRTLRASSPVPARRPTLPYGAPAPEPLPASSPLRAQSDAYFHAAEVLLQRGFAREAAFEAQKALRLCPPLPAQRAFYAYVLFVRGGRPGVELCIRHHLSQALGEAPHCERTRYYAGLIAFDRQG
jgi:hypothetical protein